MSESAWKWGAYRRGQGVEGDDSRIVYAVRAIKRELVHNGYVVSLETDRFGPATGKAVQALQAENGLLADGMVGAKTANALFRRRIWELEEEYDIPNGWFRAQVHWESLDDPGAQYTNPTGSRDRGLVQLNSELGSLTDDEAFDPAVSLPFLARHHKAGAVMYRDCKVNKHELAVARWRSPVGASEWCDHPEIVPDPDGSWGQRVAYYVGRVDTTGRLGWVG